MKKIFFASALFLLAIFLTPKVALAERTCMCAPIESFCSEVVSNSCGSGYTPVCNPSTCDTDCNCLVAPTPTPGPCLLDGTRCFSGSTPRCSNCCNGYHVVGGPGGGASICGPAPTSTPTPTPTPNTGGNTDLWCVKNKTLNTAIGCIPILTTKEAFLGFILKWAIGIGGGIAFLLIIYAGFMLMTSQGNPERLQAGKELMTSAISGLILLIFSIFILKVIGVDILGIPGFGTGP